MSESDTMFNERDRRCDAVQLMFSTDPSYDNRTIASTLKMQIWIATNNRDVPRMMKTKFPATVMVFGVVSSEGQIMPLHFFEVRLKVNTKVYLDALKSVVITWCIRWPVADPRCGTFSHCPSPPPTWTRWTTSFGHTSRTSPKPAWLPPSPEYSPSFRRRLWKRYAPSSGSVSRRWLRLKAPTLNRCQLDYIIKLPELIFSIKVLK